MSATTTQSRSREATTIEDVGHRIDDAVAIVVERDRRLTVPVDHQVRVFDNLPRRLQECGGGQAECERRARRDQPEQAIEREAVNDVREGVPVRQVLRILGACDDAVPGFDVAARADGYAAHHQERGAGCDEDGEGYERPLPARQLEVLDGAAKNVTWPRRSALARRRPLRTRRVPAAAAWFVAGHAATPR